MSRSFWQGKRVLVTGHTGFKGAWLVRWLQLLGAEPAGFALEPSTTPNLHDLLKLASQSDEMIADINDTATLEKFFKKTRPEIVFHLAAQPIVRQSYADPTNTFLTNVLGTVNLLEQVRASDDVRSVVIVTSDKCYRNDDAIRAFVENDPLGGHDPYSASKACAEIVTAAYRDSYFAGTASRQVGVGSARAGNVIGGGDWSEDRIIPDAVRAVKSGTALNLRYPNAVRPWQHVLEPLHGYLLLAQALYEDPERFAGAWNFGPDETQLPSVLELASAFMELTGSSTPISCPEGTPLREAQFLRIDPMKAISHLNWRPRLTVREAVARTAKWYRAWLEGADVDVYTTEQIREFSGAYV